MSNRAIWNVRLRHVWLATPLKGKRFKKRSRIRIGAQEAFERKGLVESPASEEKSAEAES